MAGQENLSGHRPEEQRNEPQIPQSEVGQPAYQLIKDFKRAIMDTPEFAQTLQRLYFDEITHDEYSIRGVGNAFDRPICFKKGDYRYSVKYNTKWEREELHITKSPAKHQEYDWWNESVTLSAYGTRPNRESGQFDGGRIEHEKIVYDRKVNYTTNTPTTIHRVKDFLTTNFGKSEQQ